jgi:hypothetical protein
MKIGVLWILINFGNLAFSQKLFLRFTPMLGVSFGTFKSHIKESTNNTISYLPVNNLGNIGYSSLNYSLQVDFLKFGNKLEAGLMVGNVSDFSGYTFEYFSQFPFTQEEGSTVYRSRLTTSSTRLDIGFSVSYRFTNQRDSSRWNKRIIIQPMFSFNRASDSGMKQTRRVFSLH